jgi:hypothetical protein
MLTEPKMHPDGRLTPQRYGQSPQWDAIVILAWSDWNIQNSGILRHYITCFAKDRPVYVVQTDGTSSEFQFESDADNKIIIVHVPKKFRIVDAVRLASAMRIRGVFRPLLWIINHLLSSVVQRLFPLLVICHISENLFGQIDEINLIEKYKLSSDIREIINDADLIFVPDHLSAAVRFFIKANKPVFLNSPFDDVSYLEENTAIEYIPHEDGAKVALVRADIDARLDYSMLMRLSELMPDWQFWFCGKLVDERPEWEQLKARENVSDFSRDASETIAHLACRATVALIPFRQTETDLLPSSLSITAYEFIACGLPVVSVPIDALTRPDLFEIAQDVESFADAIRMCEQSRTDPEALKLRREAAKNFFHDGRLCELTAAFNVALQRRSTLRPSLNILVLYDDRSTHVGTVAEHLGAFRKYSAHNVYFMPATRQQGFSNDSHHSPDLSVYDAVVMHYSVRISVEFHLSDDVASAVTAYQGPKLLFIQDEYDNVECARRWMERLYIDSVFTCLPPADIHKMYPKARFPHVEFLPTLTGYVPEDPALENFVLPMALRTLRLGYRGRKLPHHYGALGNEKHQIGVVLRQVAEARDIPVDIEVEDSRRIYGAAWYRFIGSVRATLGTESGSNVFDIDGGLAALAAQHRDMPYKEFAERFLGPHEGLIQMNQISPKIFEAIRLRTALVLFEGNYSGVVRANEHYIPLAKDFSNVDEVLARLEDIQFLEAMTERAYRDVIATGAYSYRCFIEGVDAYLWQRSGGRRRATIIGVPMLAIYGEENADSLLLQSKDATLVTNAPLGAALSRESVQRLGAVALSMPRAGPLDAGAIPREGGVRGRIMATAKRAWRILPLNWRDKLLVITRGTIQDNIAARPWPSRLARPFWRLLPARLRARVAGRII